MRWVYWPACWLVETSNNECVWRSRIRLSSLLPLHSQMLASLITAHTSAAAAAILHNLHTCLIASSRMAEFLHRFVALVVYNMTSYHWERREFQIKNRWSTTKKGLWIPRYLVIRIRHAELPWLSLTISLFHARYAFHKLVAHCWIDNRIWILEYIPIIVPYLW